jgi:hypothetical protein
MAGYDSYLTGHGEEEAMLGVEAYVSVTEAKNQLLDIVRRLQKGAG